MVHCNMSLSFTPALARLSLMVPVCVGCACTLALTLITYQNETRNDRAAFAAPAARVHTALAQQLAHVTGTVTRSGLAFAALDALADARSARIEHAVALLRSEYPFIVTVRRASGPAPGSGLAEQPGLRGVPGAAGSAAVELVVPDSVPTTGPTNETVFVLRLDTMFGHLMAAARRRDPLDTGAATDIQTSVYLRPGGRAAQLVYRGPAPDDCPRWPAGCDTQQVARTMHWAGQSWQVSLGRPAPSFWAVHAASASLATLGALATWFGVMLLLAQRQRTGSVIAMLQQRTGDLLSLNDILIKEFDRRRVAEQELERSRTRLRTLVEQQVRIKEGERKRIARELHDDLGQSLLTLKMDLARMSCTTPADAAVVLPREQMQLALAQIDATLAAMRLIINELRPEVLGLGLDAAISWECSKFSRRTGLTCALQADTQGTPLTDDTATALYRIVQEALTNIMRHARAGCVAIDLHAERGWVFLKVIDNGVGMPASPRRKAGSFGLLGVAERIYTLGGAFDVTSNAGTGTTLSVALPLQPPRLGEP